MDNSSRTPISLILCGLGRMGMIHIENIMASYNVHLSYIIEANLEHAEKVKKSYCLDSTKILHFQDFQLAVDDNSTQCVIICTPTDTHEDLLLKSLNAGKHVLCEKPLARNIQTIANCYKLAKEERCRFALCF